MQDIRFGVRMLSKHPGLSIIAILTFGVGMGITAFVFSIVNGIFFKGLPFDGAESIVRLAAAEPAQHLDRLEVSVHDFVAYRERQTVFDSMGAWSMEPLNLAPDAGAPERLSGAQMTPGVFDSLRVAPVLGRSIRAGDAVPGAEPVIVLGYEIWRDRFGKSPDVIGRTVRANAIRRTIVGVMPEGFGFPQRQQVWTPLEINPLATRRGEGPHHSVIARLREGVTIRQANAQAVAIAAQLAKEFPESNAGLTAWVRSYPESLLTPQIYGLMSTMFAAGIGVLLIACVNVANLMLARTSLRVREVAVRMALGAGRGRIIGQFVAESTILALAGGTIGLGLTHAALNWFRQAIEVDPPPFFITFDIDYRVLGFILVTVAGSTLFAGLMPALKATGKHAGEALKDESRGSTGLRIGKFSSALIVTEVAVSCGLLIGAGLIIKSIVRLRTVPMPFAVGSVLTGRINLPQARYDGGPACVRFYGQLLPRLESIPGVEAATLADALPASGNRRLPILIENRTHAGPRDTKALQTIVMPGYFETFQAQVLRGREFTHFDRADSPHVVIVNESFVKAHFPGTDPVGRRILLGSDGKGALWRTIVGVVPDLLMQGMRGDNQNPAGYYIPIAQSHVTNYVAIALRTRGEPAAVTRAMRAAVAEIDPDLAIYQVLTMQEMISGLTWPYRIFGSLFLAFGCVALLLAVAGLYGVMSFSVTQRMREMGIRAALGAQGNELVMLVMRRGVIRLALGLAIGLAVGIVATGPLSLILYGVHTRDPLVFGIVPMALATAGLLATFLPARRVLRIDPVIALASE